MRCNALTDEQLQEVVAAMKKSGGNITFAADIIGMHRDRFRRRVEACRNKGLLPRFGSKRAVASSLRAKPTDGIDPTPDEIRAMCDDIQRGWSRAAEARHSVMERRPYEFPHWHG